MGTRSTYRVRSKYTDPKTNKTTVKNISLMYRQFDGYPSGHPLETANWLASGKMVNGFGHINEGEVVFNGPGCLAAQLVAKYKDGCGGTYMEVMSDRGKRGEDYLYDIVVDTLTMEITYIAYENYGKRPKKIFEGKPGDFEKFINNNTLEG